MVSKSSFEQNLKEYSTNKALREARNENVTEMINEYVRENEPSES